MIPSTSLCLKNESALCGGVGALVPARRSDERIARFAAYSNDLLVFGLFHFVAVGETSYVFSYTVAAYDQGLADIVIDADIFVTFAGGLVLLGGGELYR